MKKIGWLLGIFAAVCVAQIWVPASMIRKYEATLREGRIFKVRAQPVDPLDAFRGRYVWLSLDLRTVPMPDLAPEMKHAEVFACLEDGPDGFARAKAISTARPPHHDYVEARTIGERFEPPTPEDPNAPHRAISTGEILISIPVDRYYMEETKAPAAERALQEQGRNVREEAWVLLRVRDGVAVIENLYLAGVPVEEYIAGLPSAAPP